MKSTKAAVKTTQIRDCIQFLQTENEMLGDVSVSGVIDSGRQADMDNNRKEIASLRRQLRS